MGQTYGEAGLEVPGAIIVQIESEGKGREEGEEKEEEGGEGGEIVVWLLIIIIPIFIIYLFIFFFFSFYYLGGYTKYSAMNQFDPGDSDAEGLDGYGWDKEGEEEKGKGEESPLRNSNRLSGSKRNSMFFIIYYLLF